jgi:hypothetical protein
LTEAKVRDLKTRAAYLYGFYQSTGSYGVDSDPGRIVRRDAGPLAADMLLIDDDSLGPAHRIAKYEYAAFAYVLAASLETRPAQANRLANDALKAASHAVLRISDVIDAAARGDPHAQAISKWLRESEDLNRVRSLIVIAHAIRVRAGGASGRQEVEAALNEVDPDYLQRFPPTAHPDVKRVLNHKPGRG